MTAGSRKIERRWLPSLLLAAAAVSLLPALGAARAQSLDSSAQRRLREATFEVVLEKPVSDPLSYEKTLPLELLPYAERVGKYRPLGTAFAIGHDRFVTAAHVITAGMGSPKGTLVLRDQNGKIFSVRQIVKFSGPKDYAVFTLSDPPGVSALDAHERPALSFMDLVLKGTPLQRQVGTDAVRITSLGSAAPDTTHVDRFGRTWQCGHDICPSTIASSCRSHCRRPRAMSES
jgi:hypothetical protein